MKLVRAKCSKLGERKGGRRRKAEILLEIFHTAENLPPATYLGVTSYKKQKIYSDYNFLDCDTMVLLVDTNVFERKMPPLCFRERLASVGKTTERCNAKNKKQTII